MYSLKHCHCLGSHLSLHQLLHSWLFACSVPTCLLSLLPTPISTLVAVWVLRQIFLKRKMCYCMGSRCGIHLTSLPIILFTVTCPPPGNWAHAGNFHLPSCTAGERKRLLSNTSSLTLKFQTFLKNMLNETRLRSFKGHSLMETIHNNGPRASWVSMTICIHISA